MTAERQFTLQDLTALGMPPMLRSDPPRNEPRCKIRLAIRSNAHNLPGGIRIKRGQTVDGKYKLGTHEVEPGVFEVIVYQSDLDTIKKNVEPQPQDVERVRAEHAATKQRWINEHLADSPPVMHAQRIVELEREWTNQSDHATSPEAIFTRAFGRCIKPLLSVEVIEDYIDPPRTDEAKLVESIVKHASGASNVAALVEAMKLLPQFDPDAMGRAIGAAMAEAMKSNRR